MAHEVFIGYASSDKRIADAVCAKLESEHVMCWIAPRDVLPGVEYGEAIVNAIAECRVYVLIFSARANNSPQVRREVERAVSRDRIIVPFRIEEVVPSGAMEYALSATHWLDAINPPVEDHIERLTKIIGRLTAGKEQLPPPLAQTTNPAANSIAPPNEAEPRTEAGSRSAGGVQNRQPVAEKNSQAASSITHPAEAKPRAEARRSPAKRKPSKRVTVKPAPSIAELSRLSDLSLPEELYLLFADNYTGDMSQSAEPHKLVTFGTTAAAVAELAIAKRVTLRLEEGVVWNLVGNVNVFVEVIDRTPLGDVILDVALASLTRLSSGPVLVNLAASKLQEVFGPSPDDRSLVVRHLVTKKLLGEIETKRFLSLFKSSHHPIVAIDQQKQLRDKVSTAVTTGPRFQIGLLSSWPSRMCAMFWTVYLWMA
jgi:TIR domain-containing protein/Golgi phosphoprotein 3 GPP34